QTNSGEPGRLAREHLCTGFRLPQSSGVLMIVLILGLRSVAPTGRRQPAPSSLPASLPGDTLRSPRNAVAEGAATPGRPGVDLPLAGRCRLPSPSQEHPMRRLSPSLTLLSLL